MVTFQTASIHQKGIHKMNCDSTEKHTDNQAGPERFPQRERGVVGLGVVVLPQPMRASSR